MTDYANIIRVPNLPIGKYVNEDGTPTDDFLTFMQGLITSLQRNFGNEGVVIPSQSQSNVDIIQNNTIPDPANPMASVYTCQFGTFIYIPNTEVDEENPPNDSLVVAMQEDVATGAPLFEEVLIARDYEGTAGAITNYAIVNLNNVQYKIPLYALS